MTRTISILRAIGEVFGIVLFRFRPVPRIWSIWLVSVNAASLYFIAHIEAQVLLAITIAAVLIMALIHERIGFTRILGIAHALWVPFFIWVALTTEFFFTDPAFYAWFWVLGITNAICFSVDLLEAWRFYRGDRAPHYVWNTHAAN